MNKVKITLLLVFCIWLSLHLIFRPKHSKEQFVVAHRGAPIYAPENTLAGINLAAKNGANYIEIDIQRTKDEVLVLMHDNTVDRTTNGTGIVSELDWESLQKLNVRKNGTDQRSGELIPDFNSVLEEVKDQQVTLIVEVKNPNDSPKIENQLITILENQGMVDQVLVISFDHHWLEKLVNLEPRITTGYLYAWAGPIRGKNNAKFIDVHWTNIIIDPTIIYRSSNLGYQTVVWTVNNKYLMQIMLWIGVDGITTDRLDIWNDIKLRASSEN